MSDGKERPRAKAPRHPPHAPAVPPPRGAWDCHVHLVGSDFPLWDGRSEDPPEGRLETWLDRYRAHLAALGCERGVIVHSILYGTDNSVTLAALQALGPSFRGVGLVRDDATEAELATLAEAGVRAVRLNYVHGGVLSWEGAKRLAPMLAAQGMHIEMLAHSHLHLEELASEIPTLPVRIVFDHMAWPDPTLGVTAGQLALERLLAEGHAWAKLSAAYRHTPDPAALYRRLVAANPERLVWGSDWPHLMLNGVAMPDAARDLDVLMQAIPSRADRDRLFRTNPEALYGR